MSYSFWLLLRVRRSTRKVANITMSTRERAATRAPTTTPISWLELAPDDGGRVATSMPVEVTPEVMSCRVVTEPAVVGSMVTIVDGC